MDHAPAARARAPRADTPVRISTYSRHAASKAESDPAGTLQAFTLAAAMTAVIVLATESAGSPVGG
jgi:hypothetical protein